MKRWLDLYVEHGRLAAEAINDGDWKLSRVHAAILLRAAALDPKDAAAAGAAFADSYCRTRRTHRERQN